MKSAKLLDRIYRKSRHHQVRQRAHCLLLLDQGQKDVKDLMCIVDVSGSSSCDLLKLDTKSNYKENHFQLASLRCNSMN